MNVDAETMLRHSAFGDSECSGSLRTSTQGDEAQLVCNECGAIVRTMPAADLNETLRDLELSMDVAGEICPNCTSVNLFLGSTQVSSFTCRSCGQEVYIARR